MSSQEMNSEFVAIVAETLGVPAGELSVTSEAGDFLKWDSIAHWEMIAEVEDHYDVEFTLDEAQGFERLGDVHEAVARRGAFERAA